jgi:hypothetical protein
MAALTRVNHDAAMLWHAELILAPEVGGFPARNCLRAYRAEVQARSMVVPANVSSAQVSEVILVTARPKSL